jgi:hypothetical protein
MEERLIWGVQSRDSQSKKMTIQSAKIFARLITYIITPLIIKIL